MNMKSWFFWIQKTYIERKKKKILAKDRCTFGGAWAEQFV